MIRRTQFTLGRPLQQGLNGWEKRQYRVRFERALIVVMAITIVLFTGFKRVGKKIKIPHYVFSNTIMIADLPPATEVGAMPRPPLLPQIPVPSEDEYISEDVTIDIVDFNDIDGLLPFDGPAGSGPVTGAFATGPRPIREVVPEYPDDLRKRGVEGVVMLSILVNATGAVDSVVVIGNTTRNRRLERAAVAAAYKTQYMPFDTQKGSSFWIERPTRFEGK
ncbi:TonB family protein [bacterium]|nr:TonB family protein [bacterium]